MLQLVFFLLPLGIDTLGISISLGIKSMRADALTDEKRGRRIPSWMASALLFALAETSMPLVGLAIGYVASLAISGVMHFVGPLLLIAIGSWELVEELSERFRKSKPRQKEPALVESRSAASSTLVRQLLLALSVSLDELAVGFSLGSASGSKSINPLTLCILIGLQGFLMAVIGMSLGRSLQNRLRPVKEWSELLSGVLLIGLGVWLLVT